MTNEMLIITLAVAALAALVTYLVATGKGRQALAEANKALSAVNADKARLDTELAAATEQEKSLRGQVRQLELDQQKTNTKLEAAENRKSDLDEELNQIKTSQQEAVDKMHTAEKANESAQTETKESAKQLVESKSTITRTEEKLEALQKNFNSLNREHAELETSQKERDDSHAKQLAQFEEQKQALSKEFENLANKIFEEKGKTFADTSKSSIDSLLKPFKEQIEGFQKRVNDVHDESVKGNAGLNAEIKKVLEIGLKMSDEAGNLTSALKGDSQQRGAWGEAQLKRTLEMGGLIEDAHYEAQSSFKDLDGKDKQTDYLIKLPDDKHIIIDSKVTLNDYDRAVSAESQEEHKLAMDDHIKSVKKHIDDLAKKDYTNLVGMRSPSFVLMFMPIEPAYIEALKSNKDLFSYGYNKGIVLVSHTTLIPILRTVANLWMMERSNQEAREIGDKAGDIYNQVCAVAEHLHKLGNTLGTVSNHYNKTVTALVGKQGLHGKVERFQTLSSKVSKSMPAIEPRHIDFESERLTLVVEPINENPENAVSESDEPVALEHQQKSNEVEETL